MEVKTLLKKKSKLLGTAHEYFKKTHLIRRVFPEIGKIKIGTRKPVQTEDKTVLVPVKEDRFIITKTIRGKDGNFIPDIELMKIVAERTNQDPNKLLRIPILFLFNTPELNFQMWLTCYQDGKLYCRGDGSIAYRYDSPDGKPTVVECPCERIDYPEKEKGRCKIYGRLHCLIKYAKYFGGMWVFRTTSRRTIETLYRELEYFHRLFDGVLSGFTFQLMLNREPVLVENKLQYVYTVSLLYDPDEDTIQDTVYHKIRNKVTQIKEKQYFFLTIEEEKKMIPQIMNEIIQEELEKSEEVGEEFFPEKEIKELADKINGEIHAINHEEQTAEVQTVEAQTVETQTVETAEAQIEEAKQEKGESELKQGSWATPEQAVRKINKGQINIIKRELSKAFSLDENEIEKRIENLTYQQAVEVLRKIRERKLEEAYQLISDYTSETEIETSAEDEEKFPVITLDEDLFEYEEEDRDDDIPF